MLLLFFIWLCLNAKASFHIRIIYLLKLAEQNLGFITIFLSLLGVFDFVLDALLCYSDSQCAEQQVKKHCKYHG